MTDNDIIDQILKGHRHAFKYLILKYEKLVMHMVGRVIQVQEDMEDVCQEVFIKVFRELGSFRGDARLSTWIATIAYRTSLNYLKKKKGLKTINFDNLQALENRHIDHHSPDREISEGEMRKMVRKMIESLPVNYRTVITLYHIEEFSYMEIGEITGMPEGTVKSYLFRARKLIHEKFKYFVNSSLLLML